LHLNNFLYKGLDILLKIVLWPIKNNIPYRGKDSTIGKGLFLMGNA
jgi:hypothetical protein